MARLPRLRHLRRGKYDRVRRRDRLIAWLAERATALDATGTGQAFTADVEAATGVLTAAGNPAQNETVTIGTTVYTFKTDIEAQTATGVLTATDNPDEGDTVTIGATTYTFTATVDAANKVLIGASASDTLDNLVAAITAGAGSGTLYGTGTTANASATAAAGAGDTVDVTALVAGTAGNSIATTTTGSGDATFADVTLLGGEAAEAAYTVEIGATASDTLDNLIAAINAGAGAGTVYGTGTAAHPSVSAAAGTGDTVDVTATVAGTDGNSVATTSTAGNLTWGAVTLEGGVTSNNLQAAAHGYTVGDGPFLITTSGTRPSGLLAGVLFWVKSRIDADNFTVTGKRGSPAETGVASDGVGTHTITPAASAEAVHALLKQHKPAVVNDATDVDDLAV